MAALWVYCLVVTKLSCYGKTFGYYAVLGLYTYKVNTRFVVGTTLLWFTSESSTSCPT